MFLDSSNIFQIVNDLGKLRGLLRTSINKFGFFLFPFFADDQNHYYERVLIIGGLYCVSIFYLDHSFAKMIFCG